MAKTTKPVISILGAGALARVLALALHDAGYKIDEIIARGNAGSMRRARQLAKACKADAVSVSGARLESEILWFCISDDAVADVAKQLSERIDLSWHGKYVFHSSGALPASALQPLKKKRAIVASAHPMNTFVRASAPTLRGVPFALEGDAPAIHRLRRVVADLDGECIVIPARAKALYHAMGAFASPLYVSLISAAEQVGREAGISDPGKVMALILRQTTEHIVREGTAGAFSGPIRRGDLATIRKHLDVLRALPDARAIYSALAENAVKRLPVRDRKNVMKILKNQ